MFTESMAKIAERLTHLKKWIGSLSPFPRTVPFQKWFVCLLCLQIVLCTGMNIHNNHKKPTYDICHNLQLWLQAQGSELPLAKLYSCAFCQENSLKNVDLLPDAEICLRSDFF